jgi:hypothetical protein
MAVNARRTVRRTVESPGGGGSMDAIFWLLAALIIYFLFFRPAG